MHIPIRAKQTPYADSLRYSHIGAPLSQFTGWHGAVFDAFTGLRPAAYLVAKQKRDELRIIISAKEKELEAHRLAFKRVRSELPKKVPSLDLSSFRAELVELANQSKSVQTQQIKARAKLVAVVSRREQLHSELQLASPIYLQMDMTNYSSPHWNPTPGWGSFAYNLYDVALYKGGNKNGDGRQALSLGLYFEWGAWADPYDPYYEQNGGYYTETRLVEFTGSGSGLGASFTNLSPYIEAYQTDADFNGDGCDDSVYSNGYGYSGAWLSGCGVGVMGGISYAQLGYVSGTADWNGDGNADMFIDDPWTGQCSIHSIQGGGQSVLVSAAQYAPTCQMMRTDGNGDGLDDIGFWDSYGNLTIYPHNGTSLVPDVAASIVDGFGVTHTPTYTRIERSNYSAYNNAAYPARDVTRGRYVVKKVTATDGISGTYDTNYNYFGAQVNVQGRGFAGFEKIQSVDSRNGVMSEQKFKREFPYSGMPYEVNVYQSASGPLMNSRSITAAYSTLDATAYNQRYFPYVSATAEGHYEVGGASNGQLIKQAATGNTYDTWGNITASTSTVTDKDSGSPLYNHTWTTATSATIYPNTTYWCLGLPSSVTVTQSSSVSGESTVATTKGFSTDDANCRNTAETVGSGALQVDTSYGFDGFGNVSSVAVTGRNPNNTSMTARTASISWGTTGQFPVSETNALSQTTTRTFHSTFGSLLTETDPNGIVVANTEYDAFGRAVRSTNADGTYSTLSFELASSGVDPRSKTSTTTYHYGSNNTLIRGCGVYYDVFGRAINEYCHSLTGSGYDANTRGFDALGRVSWEGMPFHANSGYEYTPAYSTTYAYDLNGRIAQVSRPQSQSVSTPATTTFAYAGRTQTITDPQGKVTTKILDAKGQMRRSQDHNGYYQNFAYDAAGSLKEVTDSLSNTLFTASYSYGIRPFQTNTNDMDMGSWAYDYNSLGELVGWSDAKSQTFSQTYDALSRVTSRTEAEGTTTFTYGTSAGSHNIGRLASVSMTGYSESLSYDSIGRPSNRSITTDQTYDIDYAYTNQGLVDTVTYPTSTSSTRVKVKYGYAYGLLQSVTDWTSGSAGTVYWTANAQNVRGQTTQETLGNGVVTNRSFDAVTGLMSSVQSAVGGGTTLQNQSYLYDLIGNVTQRQENTQGLTENFYYDNLYRLDYSQLNSSTNLDLAYDAMGNITNRTDVNGNATWTYHSTKKHAVATTGSGGASYGYDANGNMTSRAGQTISWSSYNYATGLATATESTVFYYGPDRQYYKQIYTGPSGTETTHYVGGLLEKVYDGSTTDWRHQIRAGGKVVAVVSRKSTSTNAVYYPLEDHQGSGSTLTDASGTNLVRQSYNAFGLPRDGADWDGAVPSGDKTTINGISRRGYTGHSMLGDMGLIHMNGRVQDAITGRFLSPDPTIPHPAHTQSYNRYAYVRNNPLSFIDPSGFADGYYWPHMGAGASYAEHTSQFMEWCNEIANSGEEMPEGCFNWSAADSQWLGGYMAHVANIAAMNSQVAHLNQLGQEQQSLQLQQDVARTRQQQLGYLRQRGQITVEPMTDSQTGEIIPEPQTQQQSASVLSSLKNGVSIFNIYERSFTGKDSIKDFVSNRFPGNEAALTGVGVLRFALDLKIAEVSFSLATKVVGSFGPTYAGAYTTAAWVAGPALSFTGGYAIGTAIYDISDAAGFNIGTKTYDLFHSD
jgi:RHS repeat-associated protein